jgi:hypothetical protein
MTLQERKDLYVELSDAYGFMCNAWKQAHIYKLLEELEQEIAEGQEEDEHVQSDS